MDDLSQAQFVVNFIEIKTSMVSELKGNFKLLLKADYPTGTLMRMRGSVVERRRGSVMISTSARHAVVRVSIPAQKLTNSIF